MDAPNSAALCFGMGTPRLGLGACPPGHKKTERVDVSEPASISAGIASRYATAVFELAQEAGDLKGLESDVDALGSALADSADLRALIGSPIYSRDDQTNAIAALSKAMGLSATVTGTLGLMAGRRRLFVLPQLVQSLRAMIAEAKGEVTADVTAAAPLTAAQSKSLADTLAKSVGKSVKLNVAVDETLIGGLVVKVGSKMIDTSIRAKLASLQNAMKEVG
jgi:F-type H+-transporting ATPase subunit delta